jgi:hypothetical protein
MIGTAGFCRLPFCRQASFANCRFLTPQKQKTEFRKQETESLQNQGVKNRQSQTRRTDGVENRGVLRGEPLLI